MGASVWLLWTCACGSVDAPRRDAGGDSDADTDTDADSDADSDTDSDVACERDGDPCEGGVCRDGACDAGRCFADGEFHEAGDADPANPCRHCDLAAPTRWSPVADGAECPAGLCRGGTCDPLHCFVDGAWRADGDENPANACEFCDLVAERSTWTGAPDGTPCPNGLCRSRECDTESCLIEDAWHARDAVNPADACQECDPEVARDAWTGFRDEGTACVTAGGAVGQCRGGACCAGCFDGADCLLGDTLDDCGAGGVDCARCAGNCECDSTGSCPGDDQWHRPVCASGSCTRIWEAGQWDCCDNVDGCAAVAVCDAYVGCS